MPGLSDTVHEDEQHVQPKLPASHHSAHHSHPSAAGAGPPLTQRVDLVDEDDAAAPHLRLLPGRPDHEENAQGVDAHEHAGE